MAGRRLLRARRARRRSWCATPSSSTAWSSSCSGARRRRPGTSPAATPARSRSATRRSSGSAPTPRRCSARGGSCRRGSGSLVGAGAGHGDRARHRLPQQPPARPVLRARHDRVLAGAAHRRQPLARLHLRLRGHPRALPPGLLDARHRGQARVGLASSSRSRCSLYLVELYLERSRRGYQLAAVREDEDAALSLGVPARRLKVAAIAVSAALTAVCGALWAQYVGFVDPFYVFSVDLSVRSRWPRSSAASARALGPVPRRRARHDAGDVPARAVRRHRRRPRRDLPDHLRRARSS